jgi:hypothetical protein
MYIGVVVVNVVVVFGLVSGVVVGYICKVYLV